MTEVFFLGAGFSRAVSDVMPLMPDLATEVQRRLREPLPDGALSLGSNLELWLSYLAQPQPWLSESDNLRNRAIVLEMYRVVADVVEERTERAREADCPHWLMRLLWYWHRHGAEVITVNYDVLVERAAADIQEKPASSERIRCSDLYPVPMTPAGARVGAVLASEPKSTFRLYKLHGSVNWFYSGRASFFGETIVYVPVTNWRLDPNLKQLEDSHRICTVDKVPLIVPPLFDKTPYLEHESIRNTWALAGVALRNAERVYCMGYSLPPTDIAIQMLFRANIRKRIPFIVVNLDSDCPSHYRRMFDGCPFEVEDQYVGTDALPELARSLV